MNPEGTVELKAEDGDRKVIYGLDEKTIELVDRCLDKVLDYFFSQTICPGPRLPWKKEP